LIGVKTGRVGKSKPAATKVKTEVFEDMVVEDMVAEEEDIQAEA
jgi:hypothetical protein